MDTLRSSFTLTATLFLVLNLLTTASGQNFRTHISCFSIQPVAPNNQENLNSDENDGHTHTPPLLTCQNAAARIGRVYDFGDPDDEFDLGRDPLESAQYTAHVEATNEHNVYKLALCPAVPDDFFLKKLYAQHDVYDIYYVPHPDDANVRFPDTPTSSGTVAPPPSSSTSSSRTTGSQNSTATSTRKRRREQIVVSRGMR